MNQQNKARIGFFAMLVSMGLMAMVSCSSPARRPANDGTDDPYVFLEDPLGKEATAWVKKHDAVSVPLLTGDHRYSTIFKKIHSILVAKDRIPEPGLRGKWIYNLWQDSKHVRGLWRRTTLEQYAKTTPKWETVLDIDALGAQEKESWVWRGPDCLPPEQRFCLLSLSRGGKDATVIREFDTETKEFVKGGFTLPEAKSEVAWFDENTIWVGTDFGPGSLTSSTYPRIAKLWRRGAPLSEAKEVYEGKVEDISAEGSTYHSANHAPVHILTRAPSFFESEASVYDAGRIHKIPFPHDARFEGVFNGYALAVMRTDWATPEQVFPAGSLVSIAVDEVAADVPKPRIESVFAPDAHSTLQGVAWSKDALYLTALTDVKGRIDQYSHGPSGWQAKSIALPENGSTGVISTDLYQNTVLLSFQSFLVPPSVLSYSGDGPPKTIKTLPARFNSAPYAVDQHWVVSKDGTRVPFFLIHRKNMPHNGRQPTLLTGYGGFEASETPFYLGATGKVWLERGGAFALANIRGGGEFGPKWHEAAILQNRQKAYDDFIAVAEDLEASRVTSPKKLGIIGGSNGGLLVGVMFTQRPDLFGAVVCQVPLLDMIRYPLIGAGTSWQAEYGDPNDANLRTAILKYSPYQNVRRDVVYPRVYFDTSTADDRVGPAHARKMVARMEEQGHPVVFYENTEGGHSSGADLEQSAKTKAMEFTYLWRELSGTSGL